MIQWCKKRILHLYIASLKHAKPYYIYILHRLTMQKILHLCIASLKQAKQYDIYILHNYWFFKGLHWHAAGFISRYVHFLYVLNLSSSLKCEWGGNDSFENLRQIFSTHGSPTLVLIIALPSEKYLSHGCYCTPCLLRYTSLTLQIHRSSSFNKCRECSFNYGSCMSEPCKCH